VRLAHPGRRDGCEGRSTLPIGQDENGMPIGIQVVGKRFSDLELLKIAKAIDRLK
jgi:Asp-tRNA(Asn)/Glu-tRNA(Gln) amidotransferase A subunit family amidase